MFGIFSRKAVGVNIADHSIGVAELTREKRAIKILNLGNAVLPPGLVSSGRIKDKEGLKKVLTDCFAEAKPAAIHPKKIILSLPESQVYTHLFDLPDHTKNERDALVQKEAERTIPLRKEELIFSYRTLREEKRGLAVLIVATNRAIVDEWHALFTEMGIEVEAFEYEMLAAARDVLPGSIEKPVALVDVGAFTTSIALFDEIGLRYTYALPIGGQKITEEVAETLKISLTEAEEKKKEIGVVNKDERLFFALTTALKPILDEVKTAMAYVKEKNNIDVEEVVLIGGSSLLKGLPEYLKFNLNVSVRLGSSLLVAKEGNTEITVMSDPFLYIEAIGLALRPLEHKWPLKDPAITFSEEEPEKPKETTPIETETKPEPLKANRAWIKSHPKEVQLIVIVCIGLLLVPAAFWYRSVSRKDRVSQPPPIEEALRNETFTVEAEVALTDKESIEGRIRGKVIEHKIQAAGSYSIAKTFSKSFVERSLEAGEKMWDEPLGTPPDEKNLVFPLTFRWLTYKETETQEVFRKKAELQMTNREKNIVDKVEVQNVTVTANPNILLMKGTITISFAK